MTTNCALSRPLVQRAQRVDILGDGVSETCCVTRVSTRAYASASARLNQRVERFGPANQRGERFGPAQPAGGALRPAQPGFTDGELISLVEPDERRAERGGSRVEVALAESVSKPLSHNDFRRSAPISAMTPGKCRVCTCRVPTPRCSIPSQFDTCATIKYIVVQGFRHARR